MRRSPLLHVGNFDVDIEVVDAAPPSPRGTTTVVHHLVSVARVGGRRGRMRMRRRRRPRTRRTGRGGGGLPPPLHLLLLLAAEDDDAIRGGGRVVVVVGLLHRFNVSSQAVVQRACPPYRGRSALIIPLSTFVQKKKVMATVFCN